MKKTLLCITALVFFSGCSLSLSENPDQEKFNQQYSEPTFEEEENKILNGE